MHFAIFGLSGSGKTTFIENICRDPIFFQPIQSVTRDPRPDDDASKFEYMTQEAFIKLKHSGAFFIKDCQGTNYYGYQKKALKINRLIILYGLPAKVNKTIALGGVCVLIKGDAERGLELRNDSLELREQRSNGNCILQAKYFSDPDFLEKMDLILSNEIGRIQIIVEIFKKFARFKTAEYFALQGDPKSLLFVLKIYHFSLKGMRYDFTKHQFCVRKALDNQILSYKFYHNVIIQSQYFKAHSKIPNLM